MRNNLVQSSTRQDTKNTEGKMKPIQCESFARGTIQDAPAADVSQGLADSKNITTFPGFYEGRTGCKLYTSTRFPNIEGRENLSAHKVDNVIVSDSGDIFLNTDPGNYFCWGDKYDFIIEYVDARHVIVESTTPRTILYTGAIMGAPNCLFFHKSLQIWILGLGADIYIAEAGIPSWTKVLIISRDKMLNTITDYAEYLEKTLLFNSAGLFKVDDSALPIAYKCNIDPPNIKIQSNTKTLSSLSQYRYLYSATRIHNDGGIVDRQSGTALDLETGTNIPDSGNIDYADVYTDTVISPTNPNLVSVLWVPIVPNTSPQEYQWHFTHFTVWRTLDLEALDISDVTRTKFNDPNVYVWVADVRMCAALYVTIVGDTVTALIGEFEVADTFSILQLQNGQRFEIKRFISSTEVKISTDYYYEGLSIGPVAAAIGNGRVMQASVTGNVLRVLGGDSFTVADERKTIWDSNGYKHYIVSYISPSSVQLDSTGDLPVQGFTIDPTHRNFYDTITDDTLQARMDFYYCYSRYRRAFPNCNIGKIIPGFIVCALRGQKKVYYADLQTDQDQLVGQYVPVQTSDSVQDTIMAFWLFQNILSIFCATSTWGAQLGLSDFITLPGSGESIPLLSNIKPVDKNTGCMDPNSICDIEGDMVQLVTNEPGGEAIRQFNGMAYSTENILQDSSIGGRIVRAFQKTKKLSVAIYDGLMGYVIWRKNA